METKKERSSIKISLNLGGNKRDDKSVSEYNSGGDGDFRIKSKSKEVSQALGLIEDIRSGTFNYKDLQEIYFMNDVDLEKMISETNAEEGNNERGEAHVAGHSSYREDNMYSGGDVHDDNIPRSKEFTQGKLLHSGGVDPHNHPMQISERSLTNENDEENGGASGRNLFVLNNQVGKVCIIRFPPDVSKEIKKYLLKKKLMLEIEPTNLLNSRLFFIHFRNINKKFWGILLELSTHIEVHKTLDRNNLYKTNDVSQMIYVYDPSEKRRKKKKKCKKMIKNFIKNNFQLNSGISNKVQNFHFENYAKLFKYHDIYFAEKFLHDYLNAKYYDYYDMYVKTYTEMHTHVRISQESHKKQNEIVDEMTDISEIINSLDNTYSLMRELEKETGGDISLETLLNYEITNENYESDVSDLLMGGSHYLRKRA
ncbi:hypothetical protein AK88_02859 [Plasmodium fragile]|uniref:TAFII55 protein conserved region domain-containing protein n=1 Tax=Plasmodium fragile TaxID=5857 RepID=A0A0D9QKU0_PLAFR|nr:uncharacterized protein AK88_02859 [Plasmodium fragile]KJP87427.1 hypothetical protein AK88_02859 [Plasmodium fragile]